MGGGCTILRRPNISKISANCEGDSLRLIGCLLLLSGFFITAAALVLMNSLASRMGFVAAGLGVEVLGLVLLMNGHKALQKEQR
jgi:hypothetical protein